MNDDGLKADHDFRRLKLILLLIKPIEPVASIARSISFQSLLSSPIDHHDHSECPSFRRLLLSSLMISSYSHPIFIVYILPWVPGRHQASD